MTAKSGLAAKLCAIRGEIETVPRNGYNDYHKYHYATDEDITNLIRGLMAKHGVDYSYIPLDVEFLPNNIVMVTMEVTLYDSESGETRVYPWVATAQDKNDKGIFKAYTTGLKYFWIKQFSISTGDAAEDGDHATKQTTAKQSTGRQPAKATQAQQKLVRGLMSKLGYDTPEKVKAELEKRGYPALESLPKAKVQPLIDKLNAGIAARKAAE